MKKNLCSIENLNQDAILEIVESGADFKKIRGKDDRKPLKNQCWALIFKKASTRTRISFEVGITELGGTSLFFHSGAMQLGRGEPVRDTARVAGRMLHGAVIRTYQQSEVEDFAKFSEIPTINALTDQEHPCQTLADLLTIKEIFGDFFGKKIVFIGDGICNMSISWLWTAAHLGLELCICAPEKYLPKAEGDLMQNIKNFPGKISLETDPKKAAQDAEVIYTDTWVSMGMEDEKERRIVEFADYQVNSDLLKTANRNCIVLHCMPAYRELEITNEVMEAHASSIFQQAENRLHVQKAIMNWLVT